MLFVLRVWLCVLVFGFVRVVVRVVPMVVVRVCVLVVVDHVIVGVCVTLSLSWIVLLFSVLFL